METELVWVERQSAARCGIYMLMLGGEVQYIGQSLDCDARVSEHRQGGAIPFDAVRIAEVARCALNSEERRLISEHNPPFNIAHTPRVRRFANHCGPNEFPRSVRWRGDNLEHAKLLAKAERRTLNDWLNLTVERFWEEKNKPTPQPAS